MERRTPRRNPYTECISAESDVGFKAVVISWCCVIDETIRVKHSINEDVQYIKTAFTSALKERPQESVNQTLRAQMEILRRFISTSTHQQLHSCFNFSLVLLIPDNFCWSIFLALQRGRRHHIKQNTDDESVRLSASVNEEDGGLATNYTWLERQTYLRRSGCAARSVGRRINKWVTDARHL